MRLRMAQHYTSQNRKPAATTKTTATPASQ